MQRSCEVLIVGGGPVGLVLACLLAKNGVDVVVLERRSQPRQYSRAIGLHPPALAVLNAVGIEEAALAEGTRVFSGTAYSRGRPLGSLSFEQAWPDRPFVLTLPQNRTEALLSQRLTELAPEALHTGWEATEMHNSSSHVTVHATADSEGGTAVERSWRADFVVGADGPHSLIRRTAGIGVRARELQDTYVMGDFAEHDADSVQREQASAAIYLEASGVVESFPLPEGMRRWVAHTGTELLPESAKLLTDLIAERTGEHVDPTTFTMLSAFHVRRRLAQQMVLGRCMIIGDAAHEVSPIGGQGMTLGWLDALELAPLLTKLLSDQSSNPKSLQGFEEFQTFQRQRLASARATARQAELNMALGGPKHTPALIVRNAVLRSVLTTGVRHRLARAFTMRQPLGGAETRIPR